jgi:prophage regulatory protein
MNDTPANSILRLTQVLAITGFKKSQIYNFLNARSPYHDPDFPRPRKIGKRAVGWIASDIFGWVATRATA